MKNVYDIRYEKKLIYILPRASTDGLSDTIYTKTAVILYLYYIDTVPNYYSYIDGIPNEIDVYIISSKIEVLRMIQRHIKQSERTRIQYIQKENKGRDVSALLITSSKIIKRYQYVCFVHDKKQHDEKLKKDTDFWIENLWGNLIENASHIRSILNMFEENKRLGILAPPEPVGDHFAAWYGYGWCGSFEITKDIAEKLKLNVDLSKDKPPLTLGTALWFRSDALKKLFDKDWAYSDFDDESLKHTNYLSYGIERIFAYIAQDAGYDSGTVMTADYAEKQINYLQYSMGGIFSASEHYFPFYSIEMVEKYRKGKKEMLDFVKKNPHFYLFGAGKLGRFCHYVLREQNLYPKGYLVSGAIEKKESEGLTVLSINDSNLKKDAAIIIAVFDKDARKSIRKNLKELGLYNYIEFISN